MMQKLSPHKSQENMKISISQGGGFYKKPPFPRLKAYIASGTHFYFGGIHCGCQ
jgi:hypothetical protein